MPKFHFEMISGSAMDYSTHVVEAVDSGLALSAVLTALGNPDDWDVLQSFDENGDELPPLMTMHPSWSEQDSDIPF